MIDIAEFAFDWGSWGDPAGGVWKGGALVDVCGKFVPGEGRDEKEYKTVFGPVYQTAACHGAETVNSYLNAASRLLSKRKPQLIGLHEQLIRNQQGWFRGGVVLAWAASMRERVTHLVCDLSADHVWNMGVDAARACPKAKLRQHTWNRQLDEWSGLVSIDNMRRECAIKFKKTETLEVGKKKRVTADLRTMSSLVGGYLMPYVKDAFAVPFDDGFARAAFISSPSGGVLTAAFERLISGERDVECIYYSDDSCYAIRCVEEDGTESVLLINADISACDGSHFDEVFDTAQGIMSGVASVATVAELIFDQLAWDMRLDTVDGRRQVFRPTYRRLYSGSVLTTYINNVANMVIFLSVDAAYKEHKRVHGKPPTKAQAIKMLEDSAARAGYIVTANVCECYEDVQFLKRSFSIVDGNVVPWLNLGVWFLKFGTTDGDLSGSSKVALAERARQHNAGVVLGRRHDGDHLINDAFKRAHPVRAGDLPIVLDYHGGVASSGRIPVEALARRYRLTNGDLEGLAEVVSGGRVGLAVVSRVVDRIVEVDYGIVWPNSA